MAKAGPKAGTRFSEAASRLDRVIRDVKKKQFDVTGVKGMVMPEPTVPPHVHPEEDWARRFAVHSVRPEHPRATPPLPSMAAPPADRPKRPDFMAAKAPKAPSTAEAGGPIGSVLGKPAAKRNWLGRLFRGRAG